MNLLKNRKNRNNYYYYIYSGVTYTECYFVNYKSICISDYEIKEINATSSTKRCHFNLFFFFWYCTKCKYTMHQYSLLSKLEFGGYRSSILCHLRVRCCNRLKYPLKQSQNIVFNLIPNFFNVNTSYFSQPNC